MNYSLNRSDRIFLYFVIYMLKLVINHDIVCSVLNLAVIAFTIVKTNQKTPLIKGL